MLIISLWFILLVKTLFCFTTTLRFLNKSVFWAHDASNHLLFTLEMTAFTHIPTQQFVNKKPRCLINIINFLTLSLKWATCRSRWFGWCLLSLPSLILFIFIMWLNTVLKCSILQRLHKKNKKKIDFERI